MSEYSTKKDLLYSIDVRAAQKCIKKYSTNYAYATKLFKKDTRQDTMLAYSFFRFADEIVDNPTPGSSPTDGLNKIKSDWQKYKNGQVNTSVEPDFIRGMYSICIKHGISFEYVDSFIDAMLMDLTKKRYKTYVELEEYMYGSATVVGYIMMYIVGYKNEDAFKHAKEYAEAMQLINFVRDIKEDLVTRDRIYIPEEFLNKFGITENDFLGNRMSPDLEKLIIFLVEKCRVLLNGGRSGICLLDRFAWLPVYTAGNIYECNINILEERHYDIFGPKIKIPTSRKIFIVLKSLFSIKKICKKNKV